MNESHKEVQTYQSKHLETHLSSQFPRRKYFTTEVCLYLLSALSFYFLDQIHFHEVPEF